LFVTLFVCLFVCLFVSLFVCVSARSYDFGAPAAAAPAGTSTLFERGRTPKIK
jgi:hypothetical protein